MNLQNDLKEILRTNENLYKSLNERKKSIEQMRYILNETNKKSILVGVKGGGCNGMKYYIESTNKSPTENDEQMKIDDINVIICGKSLFYIIGTEVTWKKDLMGEGFDFNNPNAVASCGCGETFSV